MATSSMNVGSKTREVVRKVRGQPTSDGAGVRLTRVIGTGALDSSRSVPAARRVPLRQSERLPRRVPESSASRLRDRDLHAGRPHAARRQPGQRGLLGPGSVQWMTAGRGIVHSEFPEQQEGLMWGFQLWVNLPRKRQDDGTARTRTSKATAFPRSSSARARARVLVGTVNGVAGPVTDVATRARLFRLAPGRGRELRRASCPKATTCSRTCTQGDAKIGACGHGRSRAASSR